MDHFVPGLNSANMLSSSINVRNAIRTKDDASKAFVALFLSQVLKNVLKGQSDLYSSAYGSNAFSQDLYNDILIKKISEDLARDNMFGFDKILGLQKQSNPSVMPGEII